MTNSKKIQTYAYVLRKRGVPERFVGAIASRKGVVGWAYIFPLLWIIFSTISMGLIVNSHVVLNYIYPISKYKSDIYVPDRGMEAPFYLFITLFIWSMPLWLLTASALHRSKDGQIDEHVLAQTATNLRLVGTNEDIFKLPKIAELEQFSELATADEFLAAYANSLSPAPTSRARARVLWAGIFSAQLIATVVAVLMTRSCYANIYNNIIEYHSFTQNFTVPLSQVSSVDVQCRSNNSLRGGVGSGKAPAYILHINGASIDLFHSYSALMPLRGDERIEKIFAYDNYFLTHGVAVSRISDIESRHCVSATKLSSGKAKRQLTYILTGT